MGLEGLRRIGHGHRPLLPPPGVLSVLGSVFACSASCTGTEIAYNSPGLVKSFKPCQLLRSPWMRPRAPTRQQSRRSRVARGGRGGGVKV